MFTPGIRRRNIFDHSHPVEELRWFGVKTQHISTHRLTRFKSFFLGSFLINDINYVMVALLVNVWFTNWFGFLFSGTTRKK